MKLEHVAINVPDPHATAAWYARQLGLRIVRVKETEPFEHFLADASGSMLELYANPRGEFPDYAAMSPFTFHLAFEAADLETERARLLDAGARPEGEPWTTPAGDRLLFLRDPWGVALQLVQRAEPMLP